MGVLSSTRTSNATKIGQTDNWDIELEADIAEIFGIEVDKVITSPIFASGSIEDDATVDVAGGQVNSDGSVTGVLRLAANVASAAGAAGVEFQSSASDRFKICAISDSLNLYWWNSDPAVLAWELKSSLDTGSGSFLALSDVYPDEDTYAGKNKFVPQVVEDEAYPDGGYLRLMAIGEGGVTKLTDLSDVDTPDPVLDAGKYLKCWSDGVDVWFDWETPAGDGSALFGGLDDVIGFGQPYTTQDAGAVAQIMRGPAAPDDGYAVRPVFTPMAYSGLHNSPLQLLAGTWTYIPWQRCATNQTSWGDDREGGDMSAFMFWDSGGGANRYFQFRLPARFVGLYDVVLSLHTDTTATRSLEVKLEVIEGDEDKVYNIQGHQVVSPGYGFTWNPNTFQITALTIVPGPYQFRFYIMIVGEGAVPPTFRLAARLSPGAGGTGTRLINSGVNVTSVYVARRC